MKCGQGPGRPCPGRQSCSPSPATVMIAVSLSDLRFLHCFSDPFKAATGLGFLLAFAPATCRDHQNGLAVADIISIVEAEGTA